MPLTKATTNVVNLDKDTTVNTLTLGRGSGNINTNAAFGLGALLSNTTGGNNTAIGRDALPNNTIGDQNTAIGSQALQSNIDGLLNTAVGNLALQDNTTGDYNSAVGVSALNNNTTGFYNSAFGFQALVTNVVGAYNSAFGENALQANTADNNTAFGASSLYSNTTGTNNTAIGILSLNSNTVFSNISGVGNNAQVTGSNQVQLGDSATTTYVYGTVQNRSDLRDKTDVRDTELGLEFVNALRPVDFKWDMREDYRPEAPKAPKEDATEEEKSAYKKAQEKWLEDVKLANITHDGSKKRSRFHHGLIAQEVKAVLDAKGVDFGGFQDHSVKGGDDVLSIGYVELIAPLIKAVQELSAKVAELEAK